MIAERIPAGLLRRRRVFHRNLLRWFDAHRRPLPWRTHRTPYRVWVAEVMLQQTRADQAAPYYERFMRRFPSLRALARASRREVLKVWAGLGYYARARRLHDVARQLARQHGGRFPRTLDGLRALSGVGPYSAAAIGSLALGLDVAVMDGNVARVLARVMGYPGEIRRLAARKVLQSWAEALLIPAQAGRFNEAMMELGALVCTPRRPRCRACPLAFVCKAFAGGDPEAYPVRRRRAPVPHKIVGAGLVVRRDGRILITRRKDASMLGGLWEFPGGTREPGESMRTCIARELKEELGIRVAVGPRLTVVRHAYTHFTIELHAHWARILSGRPRALHCAAYAWVPPARLSRYPFSRADQEILRALRAARRGH